MRGIAGQAIVSHTKISDTVYRTVFENGAMVYVNYGESDASVDGKTIKAGDYLTVKEGE